MERANKPLTLKQLKQMVGKPVWIENKKYPQLSGWDVVGKNGLYVYHGHTTSRNYTHHWLAYAHQPARIDREKWGPCMWCELNGQFGLNNYCSNCGRPLTEEAWKELVRRVFGEV